MPQLHLYVPEPVAEAIREKAESSGTSVSKYLAEMVVREVGSGWPPGFFEEVFGGWMGEDLDRGEKKLPEERDKL